MTDVFMKDLIEAINSLGEEVKIKEKIEKYNYKDIDTKKEVLFFDMTAHPPIPPKCEYINTLNKERQKRVNIFYKYVNDKSFKGVIRGIYANAIVGEFISYFCEERIVDYLLDKHIYLLVENTGVGKIFKTMFDEIRADYDIFIKDKDGDIVICDEKFNIAI